MQHKIIHKQETLVYLVLWAALFMAPAFSIYIQHNGSDEGYPWGQLIEVWRQFLVLLIAFLAHNFLVAPLIVYKQHYLRYFGLVAVLMGAFIVFQCANRPEIDHGPKLHKSEGHKPPREMDAPPEGKAFGQPPADFQRPPRKPRPPRDKMPPAFFGEHDAIFSIMLFLMLGMNLGVKFFFRQREDQRRMALLEKEKLEQQLEYLKYQIKPHFLMNTLNNIHALVDIDQELAKDTIVELSRIMRFMLYEGSKQQVPLQHEVEFLKNYIKLMSLRYSSKVDIKTDIPDTMPNSLIPPLMLITFVENAFKHGVSYQQQSFIDIKIEADTHLRFVCRNSRIPKDEDQQGGVGLKNVKRRLELIYGHHYTLDIKDEPQCYTVRLEIPLQQG